MATEQDNSSLSVTATEDLTNAKYKVVTLAGAIAQAANYKTAAGICKTSPGSGYNSQAVYFGLTKAVFGAAVSTLGFPLKVANSGFLVACASGDASVGRALATAASGDIQPVAVDFLNLGWFGG